MSLPRQNLFEAFEGNASVVGGRKAPDPIAAAFERGRMEGAAEGALEGRVLGVREGRAAGFAAGRAEGVAAGRDEGRVQATESRDASLLAIADGLATAEKRRAQAERRVAAIAATAVRSALSALLPRLCRRGLADEAAAMAREMCAGAACGDAVLLVAPEHEEATREALRQGAPAKGREIAVEIDSDLSTQAARLEWRDGFVAFDGDEIAERILARLDAALTKVAPSGPPNEASPSFAESPAVAPRPPTALAEDLV